MSLLEGELAEIIGDALVAADIPYDMTIPRLHQEPPPDDWPSWQEWLAPITVVEHEFQGFIDTYDARLIAAGVVNVGDVKIVIIQQGMPFRPDLTDTITARGATYTILDIAEDPARATLEVRAKR
ncbi:hypothetical protein KYK29_10405 [Shinella daejeonensis]|uniref:hypothetical protein n=1 Tax=Shinella daejeonensis TaxID=659017 RepID=UPI0020C7FD13|nr:hypothetical protein [Shinella daejeonensis]MCP8895345.1 hypothetical protein [Shinella daejeonensis]